MPPLDPRTYQNRSRAHFDCIVGGLPALEAPLQNLNPVSCRQHCDSQPLCVAYEVGEAPNCCRLYGECEALGGGELFADAGILYEKQPPTCEDHLMNGDESDVDCGGSCPAKCCSARGMPGSRNCTCDVGWEPSSSLIRLLRPMECSQGDFVGIGTADDAAACRVACAHEPRCAFAKWSGTRHLCGMYSHCSSDGAATMDASVVVFEKSAKGACKWPPHCFDGILSGDETAVDCGKSCAPSRRHRRNRGRAAASSTPCPPTRRLAEHA